MNLVAERQIHLTSLEIKNVYQFIGCYSKNTRQDHSALQRPNMYEQLQKNNI